MVSGNDCFHTIYCYRNHKGCCLVLVRKNNSFSQSEGVAAFWTGIGLPSESWIIARCVTGNGGRIFSPLKLDSLSNMKAVRRISLSVGFVSVRVESFAEGADVLRSPCSRVDIFHVDISIRIDLLRLPALFSCYC